MRFITNTFGRVKLVTFKEFLKEVPIKILDHNYPYYGFYVQRRSRKGIEQSKDLPFVMGEYSSLTVPLKMGDPVIILKWHLKEQAEHDIAFGVMPVSDVFWYLCGQHAKAGGNPTHLVRTSSRTWLATNIQDFLIIQNNNGIGLACKKPMRTFLTRVFKGDYNNV